MSDLSSARHHIIHLESELHRLRLDFHRYRDIQLELERRIEMLEQEREQTRRVIQTLQQQQSPSAAVPIDQSANQSSNFSSVPMPANTKSEPTFLSQASTASPAFNSAGTLLPPAAFQYPPGGQQLHLQPQSQYFSSPAPVQAAAANTNISSSSAYSYSAPVPAPMPIPHSSPAQVSSSSFSSSSSIPAQRQFQLSSNWSPNPPHVEFLLNPPLSLPNPSYIHSSLQFLLSHRLNFLSPKPTGAPIPVLHSLIRDRFQATEAELNSLFKIRHCSYSEFLALVPPAIRDHSSFREFHAPNAHSYNATGIYLCSVQFRHLINTEVALFASAATNQNAARANAVQLAMLQLAMQPETMPAVKLQKIPEIQWNSTIPNANHTNLKNFLGKVSPGGEYSESSETIAALSAVDSKDVKGFGSQRLQVTLKWNGVELARGVGDGIVQAREDAATKAFQSMKAHLDTIIASGLRGLEEYERLLREQANSGGGMKLER